MKTIEDLLQENSLARANAAAERQQAAEAFADLQQLLEKVRQNLSAKKALSRAVSIEQQLLTKLEERNMSSIAGLVANCRRSFIENDFPSVVALLSTEEQHLLCDFLDNKIATDEAMLESMNDYLEKQGAHEAVQEALRLRKDEFEKDKIARQFLSV